jgi:ADP-heptose:LPS heptosyltransferase
MVRDASEREDEIQSLLVIHQGALGDFILALPALDVLRKTYPRARPVIMGYPRILELVEKRFYAEEIVSVDQRGMASFYVRDGVLDGALAHFFSTFDLIAVFGKEGQGTVLGNLERVCEGRLLHIDAFPPRGEKIHVSEHLLRELRRYGFSISGQEPKLYVTGADQERGRNECARRGLSATERSEAIVLHPGSGSKKKVWPLDRFVDLALYLQQHLRARILVVIGPAEGKEVQKAFEGSEWDGDLRAPLLLGKMSLLELASVIEGCRVFIGNDSGITHMAAALGIPTVAIFGPTDPKVWAPTGEHVVIVQKRIECSPCSREEFVRCQGSECLKGVEREDVLAGLATLGLEV